MGKALDCRRTDDGLGKAEPAARRDLFGIGLGQKGLKRLFAAAPAKNIGVITLQ